MTPIVAKRIVTGLIPCGLAAVVLFLAACTKAPPRPSPPAISSGAAASRSEKTVRATETGQGRVSHPPLASEEAEDSTRAPNELTGNIEGRVTDDTGASIVSAEVRLTTEATGRVRTGQTNEVGTYNFRDVRTGTYTVQVDLAGFKTATRRGVRVESGQNIRIDLVLEIGDLADAITVSESGSAGVLGAAPGGTSPTLSPVFNTEEYGIVKESGFSSVVNRPLSTFSIDVDTASYALLRGFLRDGRLPPADAVRIEELINYFDYDYPEPEEGEPFGIVTEIGVCPWSPSHRLVHIGLRSKPVATANLPPANLVFLLDVSGSMDSADKLPLLKKAFSLLTRQLRPQDRVSVVVYAGAARMVLPPTSGAQKAKILAAVSDLEADGSTAGGAGIQLAYKLARESFIEAGSNRVILATDGDFNVGVSSDGELVKLIERERETGIFLSVLGFGTGNLKDSKMEKLADHGNGNYSYVDSLLEARRVLVKQMGATLLTVAKDVKLQVEFNPEQVKAYRLIGYENRLLRDEEFNDDRKDAGDLGAGHSVTALYEVIPASSDEPLPGVDPLKYQKTTVRTSAAGGDEVVTVKLRYKLPSGSKSRLLTRVLESPVDGTVPSNAFRFAAAVAEFGLCLRDSPYKGTSDYDHAFEQVRRNLGGDEEGRRSELLFLIKTAKELTTESKAGRTNTP